MTTTRGGELLSLAAIVGEAGDGSNYANWCKLQRLLGAAVIDVERQCQMLDVARIAHGRGPRKRSASWDIDICIMAASRPLEALDDTRRIDELVTCEGIAAAPV